MRQERISAYRVMWIFVAFDLPTKTKTDQKRVAHFRKGLIQDGFTMFQYSIYTRHCGSSENAQVHINRIKTILPPKGKVSMLQLTDKQFGRMEIFYGRKEIPAKNVPRQLELF